MGLDLRAKNYPNENLCVRYTEFGFIRKQIAKSYNREFGELYERFYRGEKLTELENNRYNEICDDDLDLLLLHSDCDGKLTYQECKRISKSLDKFEFKYPEEWRQDYKDKFYILKDMIQWCGKNRITLYFR